ncbi:MAG: M23 family peptidase [Epsilonproteobacteria bacterium]|nr:M23 family peptidase [Campylobacterota bacterium]NPA64090.1 M23 family metallopeptidase [Campylobacterota bacterium]
MRILFALLWAAALFGAELFNGTTYITHYRSTIQSVYPYTTVGSLAIFPIDYHAKGKRTIFIDGEPITLLIKPKNYPKERIRVPKSKVHPPKSLQKRISAEYKEAMKIYATTTPISYIHKPFVLPLSTPITSSYGNARLFNGSLKSFHSGTDFKAKVGTPIKAINDGKVVLVKDRYYAGGSVIVDHGRGIYSCYYHLSKFLVKKGEKVKRGQIIAKSGKSGRVSGPHLHLTIKIKGISVDPLQFIEAFNAKISSPR